VLDDPERVASAASAAASGAAAIWSFVSQAADALFGLPIQVVLACFTASAAARTFVGSSGLWQTAGLIVLYAALGAWTIPLALHLSGLPTSVAAGVGVLISGGVQLPVVRDWVWSTLKSFVQRKPPTDAPPGGKQ
jgi:hypothetical protein